MAEAHRSRDDQFPLRPPVSWCLVIVLGALCAGSIQVQGPAVEPLQDSPLVAPPPPAQPALQVVPIYLAYDYAPASTHAMMLDYCRPFMGPRPTRWVTAPSQQAANAGVSCVSASPAPTSSGPRLRAVA
jgi:hypothetical protein